jgi:hypothetical protein
VRSGEKPGREAGGGSFADRSRVVVDIQTLWSDPKGNALAAGGRARAENPLALAVFYPRHTGRFAPKTPVPGRSAHHSPVP